MSQKSWNIKITSGEKEGKLGMQALERKAKNKNTFISTRKRKTFFVQMDLLLHVCFWQV